MIKEHRLLLRTPHLLRRYVKNITSATLRFSLSVRRTLKNGLSEEEKKHIAAYIKGY